MFDVLKMFYQRYSRRSVQFSSKGGGVAMGIGGGVVIGRIVFFPLTLVDVFVLLNVKRFELRKAVEALL